MDIKRFELNEDRHDGTNMLPKEVLYRVSSLLEELHKFTGRMLMGIFENPQNETTHNSWSMKFKMPVDRHYNEYVYDHVKGLEEKYDMKLEEPFLIFNHEEDKYKIPLNINMSASNMIYDEEGEENLSYSVWINTYVAQKI